MTTSMQHELQELRAAAEHHVARHLHLKHFAYPAGTRMAVNLTVDFDAMLLRRYPITGSYSCNLSGHPFI